MEKNKRAISREEIVAEYLAGGISFRELGKKYGKNFRKIHDWVLAYQGRGKKKHAVKIDTRQQAPLPVEVQKLQVELRKAQLHNKLLEALLDIGVEQYGVDLRKKTGAKRS
jgi:transposase-like protein